MRYVFMVLVMLFIVGLGIYMLVTGNITSYTPIITPPHQRQSDHNWQKKPEYASLYAD